MLTPQLTPTLERKRRTPALSAHVRRKTRGEHRALVDRLHVTSRGVTRARYAKLLSRMLGILVPLEDRLDAVPMLAEVLPDLAERRKAHLVMRDLQTLDGDVEISQCTWLPPMTDVPRALGVMFVIESLLRGAPELAASIRAEIGEDAPAEFFHCYGADSDARWNEFRAIVDNRIVGDDARRQFVQSVRSTFHALESWFELEGELFADA